jgi:hypothetical protein
MAKKNHMLLLDEDVWAASQDLARLRAVQQHRRVSVNAMVNAFLEAEVAAARASGELPPAEEPGPALPAEAVRGSR